MIKKKIPPKVPFIADHIENLSKPINRLSIEFDPTKAPGPEDYTMNYYEKAEAEQSDSSSSKEESHGN
jgi:hypothetical protein